MCGYCPRGRRPGGLWDGGARSAVDTTEAGGHLTADVEGLALYYAGDGTGYLLASSQGSSEFVIYERAGNNDHVGTFTIVASGTIDAVSTTDGIDVSNVAMGSAFPMGIFVAQDDDNGSSNQNFKLVPWEEIAQAFPVPLTIDTSWNPRGIQSLPAISRRGHRFTAALLACAGLVEIAGRCRNRAR